MGQEFIFLKYGFDTLWQNPHESPLRQRMREDMVLHNLSKNTQENYLNEF